MFSQEENTTINALFHDDENTTIDALFHDASDNEGNPSPSVWDISSTPQTPSTTAKKPVKRKYLVMVKEHNDDDDEAPLWSKVVKVVAVSPAPSPGDDAREGLPKMANAPPRYEPVKKKARKGDVTSTGTIKTTPGPKPATKTKPISPPTPIPIPTPDKKPKITHRLVPVSKSPSLSSITSSPANDALDDDDPKKLWCHCRAPMGEREMILCDDKGCGVGWYHMDCVGIGDGEEPVRWFCKGCRQKRGGAGVRRWLEGPAPWGEWEKKHKQGMKGRKTRR